MRGESVSEFIRRAVTARTDETLSEDRRELFADVAGIVRSEGGRAERTGEAFTEALVEDLARRDSH